MIRVMVLYPVGDDTRFDGDYWVNIHLPLVEAAWPQLAKAEGDLGLEGQPYHAVAHLFFDSMDAMQAAMTEPRTGEVMGDLVNYTNSTPVMQISTVAGGA
jgi:uncharacterized protein (TIGR02118 family)